MDKERRKEASSPYIPHTVLLHDAEELDNNLGGRADQDLSLSGFLGVVDGVERIVED